MFFSSDTQTKVAKLGPWRGKWQPTPVFLPEEFHGQRSQRKLVGYSPFGHKESDTTKAANTHTHTSHPKFARIQFPGDHRAPPLPEI